MIRHKSSFKKAVFPPTLAVSRGGAASKTNWSDWDPKGTKPANFLRGRTSRAAPQPIPAAVTGRRSVGPEALYFTVGILVIGFAVLF